LLVAKGAKVSMCSGEATPVKASVVGLSKSLPAKYEPPEKAPEILPFP